MGPHDVGLPVCPQCSAVIGFHPRIHTELNKRKHQVVSAYEQEFALKTSAIKLQEGLTELMSHMPSQWKLKSPPMNAGYQELMELKIKCQLINLISTKQAPEYTLKDTVCQMVAEAAFVGPHFAQSLLSVVPSGADIEILCFSLGHWRTCHSCQPGRVFSSTLNDRCCDDISV